MLIDEIRELLSPAAAMHSVADVGQASATRLSNWTTGAVASPALFRDELHKGCCVIREAGTWRAAAQRILPNGPGQPILWPPL
jgi:hypothetical protein